MKTYYDINIVKLLLDRGADPNQRDQKGRTALHVAAMINKREVVSPLLKYGADPHLLDNTMRYASHYAKDSYLRHLILRALQPLERKDTEHASHHPYTSASAAAPETASSVPQVTSATFFATQELSDNGARDVERGGKAPQTRNAILHAEDKTAPAALSSRNKSTQKSLQITHCQFFKPGNPESCLRVHNVNLCMLITHRIAVDDITDVSHFFLVESKVTIEKQQAVIYTLLERVTNGNRAVINIVWSSRDVW